MGVKLLQASLSAVTSRVGTLKEAMEVEDETDIGAMEQVVDGLQELEFRKMGDEEEKKGGLDSHGEVFGRTKKKSDGPVVDNYDRFKMNNGKEVFAEKAYLVGVECKGSEADYFGIEESMKELAQLADIAGLLVMGATHQKQINGNIASSSGRSDYLPPPSS